MADEETIGSPDALAVPLGDGRGWTRPCQSPGWQGVSRENRIPDETGTMVFPSLQLVSLVMVLLAPLI